MTVIRANDLKTRVMNVPERVKLSVVRFWIEDTAQHDATVNVRVRVANPNKLRRWREQEATGTVCKGEKGWLTVTLARPIRLKVGDVLRVDSEEVAE